MAVVNGQVANAASFNGAFISRTTDSSTVGVLTLNNTSNFLSGAQITNLQRYINEIALVLGVSGEGDPSANTYASAFVLQTGDTRKQALERIDATYSPLTGHDHDGIDSKKISAASLTGLNYHRADWQTLDLVGVSGQTSDITAAMDAGAKLPGGTATTTGVVTDPPLNRVEIRSKLTQTYIEDAEGQRVYGRITYVAGVWTLSLYTLEAGVETAHTLASQDLLIAYKEVYTLDMLPTFGADVGVLGTMDLTSDIIYATETIAGKILLANDVTPPIAASGSLGTSIAAAREDHTHAGTHSLGLFGVAGAALRGDVQLEGSGGITLSYNSGRIRITSVAQPEIEYRTISAAEATAKQLTLSATPLTASKVMVDVIGGGSQQYAVDYVVTGAILDWASLGLDSIPLSQGDKLRIVYWS